MLLAMRLRILAVSAVALESDLGFRSSSTTLGVIVIGRGLDFEGGLFRQTAPAGYT